jgi:iron complex outermembrane receptor protein
MAWQRTADAWAATVRVQWRNHGDHFRWDINRPGFAENEHRTDAAEANVTVARPVGDRAHLAFGAMAGGDWIRSSGLGAHRYARAAGYGELRWHPAPRAVVQGGLRLDRYSTFGGSWSPTLSSGVWLTPALRLRASTSRAFRIPTFTELYYQDPGHLARSDLRAESSWAVDGGVDWTRTGWELSFSAFRRGDRDVIDWVRPSAADRWRTTNVRGVTTRGIEASAARRWRAALVRLAYAAHDVDAPSLTLLSKYVLDYARHSASASVASPIAFGVRGAVTVDHRRRVDGQTYALVNVRVARGFGRADFHIDASNLLQERYIEVPGVEMPGRWLTAGFTLRH